MKQTILNPSIIRIRSYATSTNIKDFHDKHQLPHWTSDPKKLFGLDNDMNLTPKETDLFIKSNYNKFLKIYHPDIINNIEVHDEKNKLMNNEEKRKRFDEIQKHYDILKNPVRRNAYLRSDVTWEDYKYKTHRTDRNSTFGNFETFRMSNSHRRQYNFDNNEEFWKAGTWEDYYKMKYDKTPPTREQFEKNKFKILYAVLMVMGITTTIQLILAFDKSRRMNYEINLTNLKLLQEMNYDVEPDTPLSSIRRLLINRRSKENDIEKLRQMEVEDAQLLTNYAKKRVEKFQDPQPITPSKD
ncbi:hypothetical protein CLIB1444_04S10352 [[Candida] jaroonii]|uniref:Uncharacterized protein n=1 Tax=[Candida] jaroonii TaxID=467808 RepID=A0ACA9Y7A3_9ASCO|nr:hypothetical protein CLIB1444_04S10352 [[Candida] jaroonii]